MKWNKQWKTLSRDQKAAWRQWARNNPVLLSSGAVRRVSGEKAFTVVLNNRALAGDAANPAVVPAAVTWEDGALGIQDAGPYTAGNGTLVLRTTVELGASRWFVWATKPMRESEADAHGQLRFITCLVIAGTVEFDECTGDFAPAYVAVHGSFKGPEAEGGWGTDPHLLWLRIHQYGHGQLSPGVMLKAWINIEL